MKKILVTAILLLLANSLPAAHVLVWNFDPLDRFTDPEIGKTIDCAYWIKECLTVNGHTYQEWKDTLLPSNLDAYDVIMGTLGWYRC